MSAADGVIAGYIEFLKRYYRTLDLMSAQGLEQVERLVTEAKAYAAAIAEHVVEPAPTVVDVGSGAGLPGIVVAIALPSAKVFLVERRRRRAAFLELVTARLSITNTTVVNGDVRHLKGVCANAVTAQAVASLTDVAGLTRHLHADPCLLVSRRGPNWEEEIHGLSAYIARTASGTASVIQAPPSADGPVSANTAEAESGRAVAVLGAEALEQRGSLVALRLAGGPACRSSG